MSDIALFNPSQLPAFAKERSGLSDVAKALTGGGVNHVKRISIKGGVFRMMAGGKEVASIDERFLDVVIVNAAPKVSRVLYLKKWDAENPAAPDCWSPDGEKPAPDAENKQHTNCADCPKNIAGSGEGNSRACRFQQRVAVVLANDIGGDVFQLTLPATSVFGKEVDGKRPLQAYARYLAAQSISPDMVVTELRFDTKVESPKLYFSPKKWLTDEQFAQAQEQGKTADAIEAITMTVAKVDNVKSAPPVLEGKPPVTAKKNPLKKQEEVVETTNEEVVEPEVRKPAAKTNAVPDKKSLADLADEWDD